MKFEFEQDNALRPVHCGGTHASVRGTSGVSGLVHNRGNYAELIGAVGKRTFTIQLDMPFASTAETIKPNVITLANAIVEKLKQGEPNGRETRRP
jgi:hypothetical protein